MNFTHRCACILCFCLGIICSMFLNQLIYYNYQKILCAHIPDNYGIIESLFRLKDPTNDHHTKRTSTAYPVGDKHSTKPVITSFKALQKLRNQSELQVMESMKKIRVLCWILTGPQNHEAKAQNVKKTWGKRCDKLLFISTTKDDKLPTTVINGTKEGRGGLWSKTRGAFQHIYDKYLENFDYFMKADDDTYVIMENLKYLLKDYNASVPNFFGCEFELEDNKKKEGMTRWNSGGAGYVLSRAAVKSLVENGYKNPSCKNVNETGDEDLNISLCLSAANVTYVDSRDELGRYRFISYPAKAHLVNAVPKWWFKFIKYPQKTGLDCCSEFAISFHYMTYNEMMLYEYLLYHVRPYGVHGLTNRITVND